MTVKELIEQLEKQDPDKQVYIEQGEEYPYMRAYSVKEKKLTDPYSLSENAEMQVVVIEYY